MELREMRARCPACEALLLTDLGLHRRPELTATGGITGFSASKFVLDTSGFANPIADLSVFRVGNDLVLSFPAVPEPSTVAAAFALLLGALILHRHRSRSRES